MVRPLQDPPLLRRHRFPECSGHTSHVFPEGSTIIHILGAVTTMLHRSHDRIGCAAPARRRGLRLVRFERSMIP